MKIILVTSIIISWLSLPDKKRVGTFPFRQIIGISKVSHETGLMNEGNGVFFYSERGTAVSRNPFRSKNPKIFQPVFIFYFLAPKNVPFYFKAHLLRVDFVCFAQQLSGRKVWHKSQTFLLKLIAPPAQKKKKLFISLLGCIRSFFIFAQMLNMSNLLYIRSLTSKKLLATQTRRK